MKNLRKEGWKTSSLERTAYGLNILGINMFYMFLLMFLSTYLLMQGLTPAMTATVILIVKIWDSINDMIFGGLMDKIKFKKDKFLPWLKLSIILIPIATFLVFAMPNNFSQTAKLIWFAVTYLLWDIVYTIADAPSFAILTTMTDNQNEKTSLMSLNRIFASFGIVAIIFGQVLTSEAFGFTFTMVALIFSIIGFLIRVPSFFAIKERVAVERLEGEKEYTFKEMFVYLGSNKFLLLFYVGYFFFYCFNTMSSVTQFVAFYLFENAVLATVISLVSLLPAIIIAMIIPMIVARVDKYKVFIISVIGTVVTGLLMWSLGYNSFGLHILLLIIRGVFAGGVMTLAYYFTPDCAEYGRYKSGIDGRGITFALQTFATKLMASVSSALSLATLGWFGWTTIQAGSFAELAEYGITQSEQALNGLWFVYIGLPTLGAIVGAIIWRFYKLRDKDVKIMIQYNTSKITKEEATALLGNEF